MTSFKQMTSDLAFAAQIAYHSADVIEPSDVENGILNLSYKNLINLPTIGDPEGVIHLILDSNFISETVQLPLMPNLETISLNNNKIFDLDLFLDQLSDKCPSLTYVSLMGCPACPYPFNDLESDTCRNYRNTIVSTLPYIRFIDHIPVQKDDHSYTAPKPTRSNAMGAKDKTTAVYRRVRRYYTGKYSEGNRFITDNEL